MRSFYLADQSEPDEGKFVWAYRIRIENTGRETVQLLRRTWLITDARGRTQRVQGAGVVGEQPVIEPGEAFEYTSGTPLDTPSGFMAGTYHMIETGGGEGFDVDHPRLQPRQSAPGQGGCTEPSGWPGRAWHDGLRLRAGRLMSRPGSGTVAWIR